MTGDLTQTATLRLEYGLATTCEYCDDASHPADDLRVFIKSGRWSDDTAGLKVLCSECAPEFEVNDRYSYVGELLEVGER